MASSKDPSYWAKSSYNRERSCDRKGGTIETPWKVLRIKIRDSRKKRLPATSSRKGEQAKGRREASKKSDLEPSDTGMSGWKRRPASGPKNPISITEPPRKKADERRVSLRRARRNRRGYIREQPDKGGKESDDLWELTDRAIVLS